MIVSVHLADVGRRAFGILRQRLDPAGTPGLDYAVTVLTAPLGGGLAPRPELGRAGLIAAWRDDEALDEFLESHPLAERLVRGWHVRLEPLRISGSWSGMPGLTARDRPLDDEEPVAVLTLGHLRFRRARSFLRSSAAAEEAALASGDGLLASTGLARPPRLVSTFSLWRSAAAMREYAYDKSGAHQASVRADRNHPFHHESAFIRFRPYASHGTWGDRDPLDAT